MALTERYCTAAGAGAHNGTTEADAWSITEAATGAAAGHRVNIKGNITTAAAVTFAAGTMGSPIVFRGYSSTIGDLATLGRTLGGYGPLNTTGFPVITTTAGNFTFGNYNIVESLSFTANRTSFAVTIGNEAAFRFCTAANTNAAAAASALTTANSRVLLMDCDFTAACAASTTTGVLNITGSLFRMVRCRLTATNNAHLVRHSITSPLFVLFCQFYNTTGAALYCQNQSAVAGGIIMGNTCYNVTGDFLQTPNSATGQIGGALIDSNHVTDGNRFIDNLYAVVPSFYYITNNRTRDLTAADVNMGDAPVWAAVTTDTGAAATDYVNAGGADFRLIDLAPGRNAASLAKTDIGATQIEEATAATSFLRRQLRRLR